MIDAHHHLWDPGARTYEWLENDQVWASKDALSRLRRRFVLADLSPVAVAKGVSGTVVVQTVSNEWETRDLLAFAAGKDPYGDHPGNADAGPLDKRSGPIGTSVSVLGVVGWVDVAAPNVNHAIARLRAAPGGSHLCGIRHPLLDEPDPEWLARADVRRGLRALGEAGLAFDVIAPIERLYEVITAAQAVAGVHFVLEHMGGPPIASVPSTALSANWGDAIRKLGALENVTCKISGMHTPVAHASLLRPSFEVVLEHFGPERLMFGSDWPVSSLSAPYDEVVGMYTELTNELSVAERQAIFEQTARRVYGL